MLRPSPPPMVVAALEAFALAVRERFGDRVTAVVLFGSHARGEAHEDSDVDVMVAIDELSHEERRDVIDMAYAVDSRGADWVGLTPLVYSTAQAASMRAGGRRLFRDIDREGIPA